MTTINIGQPLNLINMKQLLPHASYEVSVLLKQKGYTKCGSPYYYRGNPNLKAPFNTDGLLQSHFEKTYVLEHIYAPYLVEIQQWLRTKYDLIVTVTCARRKNINAKRKFNFNINTTDNRYYISKIMYSNHDKALDEAILAALTYI